MCRVELFCCTVGLSPVICHPSHIANYYLFLVSYYLFLVSYYLFSPISSCILSPPVSYLLLGLDKVYSILDDFTTERSSALGVMSAAVSGTSSLEVASYRKIQVSTSHHVRVCCTASLIPIAHWRYFLLPSSTDCNTDIQHTSAKEESAILPLPSLSLCILYHITLLLLCVLTKSLSLLSLFFPLLPSSLLPSPLLPIPLPILSFSSPLLYSTLPS
jgi:hypothetical protein